MEQKPIETAIDYKHSKNKYLSLYVSAKNSRKYVGGRKKRKSNYRDNHFQKSPRKKHQIQDAIEYKKQPKLVRLGKNVIMKQIGDFNLSDVVDITITHYPGFHHKLEDLRALPRDYLLGERVEIDYWNTNNVHLIGTILCISNCGQFELGQITYYDARKQRTNGLGLRQDSYWFHMNCINSIHLIRDDQNLDIRSLILDIMKLKLIHYFLYICAFKTDDDGESSSIYQSPLQYLIKADYDATHKQQLNEISDSDIIHCAFAVTMTSQFVYGAKQNDFDYIRRNDWKTEPTYFKHEQLLQLLCSYKQCLIDYIGRKQSEERERKQQANDVEMNEEDETTQQNVSFMDWDTRNIRGEIKTTKEQNRTV
eukprot:319934_1